MSRILLKAKPAAAGSQDQLARADHLEAGEGLADRRQLDPVDIEARRQFGHPQHHEARRAR